SALPMFLNGVFFMRSTKARSSAVNRSDTVTSSLLCMMWSDGLEIGPRLAWRLRVIDAQPVGLRALAHRVDGHRHADVGSDLFVLENLPRDFGDGVAAGFVFRLPKPIRALRRDAFEAAIAE